MQKLTTEQLRSVVNTRIAELDSFKYMSQALATVEQADLKVAEAKESLAQYQHKIAEQEAKLAQMEQEFDAKKAAAQERHDVRMDQLKEQAAEAQKGLTAQHAALAEVKAHMQTVQDRHAADLAQWQERIKAARTEYEKVQLGISQAKQQFDAFAALIDGKGRL